jgi:hypothetical protein
MASIHANESAATILPVVAMGMKVNGSSDQVSLKSFGVCSYGGDFRK